MSVLKSPNFDATNIKWFTVSHIHRTDFPNHHLSHFEAICSCDFICGHVTFKHGWQNIPGFTPYQAQFTRKIHCKH